MINALKRALQLVSPVDAALLPPPASPREQLRAAQEALKAAERELEARAAETANVRRLIEDAADAEAAQHAAENAVRLATQTWAEAGAVGEPPANVKALTKAAQTARDAAYAARLRAQGLQDALNTPDWNDERSRTNAGNNMLPSHADARFQLELVKEQLNTAIRDVMFEELQPVLARAHEAREALAAEAPAIFALYQVMRMSTNYYPFAGGSAELQQQLKQLCGPLPIQREIDVYLSAGDHAYPELKKGWAALGRALATDADATLATPNSGTG
jgi:hypothetical protein